MLSSQYQRTPRSKALRLSEKSAAPRSSGLENVPRNETRLSCCWQLRGMHAARMMCAPPLCGDRMVYTSEW